MNAPRVSVSLVASITLAGLACFSGVAHAAPGDLDPSFGSGGQVVTFERGGNAAVVLVQPDGKIVTVGFCERTAGVSVMREFCLARYNADGSLDATFDGDGIVRTEREFDAAASDGALQPDGKIIAAGYCQVQAPPGSFFSTVSRPCLARYLSDGSLDGSFGVGGQSVGETEGVLNAISLQSDGKIAAALSCSLPPPAPAFGAFCVIRYDSGGALDSSFGGGGVTLTRMGIGNDRTTDVIVQPDGKIVLAGVCSPVSQLSWSVCLARYQGNGTLDGGFSEDGKVTTAGMGGPASKIPIALQGDGKIVVASDCISAYCVARYLPDGSADPSFGGGGVVFAGFGAPSHQAGAVLIGSDNKIVTTGSCRVGPTLSGIAFCLSRLNGDGSRDLGFGAFGQVTTEFFPGSNNDLGGPGALQTDGRIVVGGTCATLNFAICLARYLGDGAPPPPENEPPTDIALSPSSLAENEPGGSTVGSFSTTDPDSTSFTYALVTGDGDADNGAFTVEGGTLEVATSLDFEEKSIYTIRVRSTDDDGLAFEKSLTVSVTNVNEAPVARDDPYVTAQGNVLPITIASSVLNNDFDPDSGTTLTAVLVAGPAHGGLTLNPDGSFRYAPDAFFSGTDSFSYRASDGSLTSSSATVTVTVNSLESIIDADPVIPWFMKILLERLLDFDDLDGCRRVTAFEAQVHQLTPDRISPETAELLLTWANRVESGCPLPHVGIRG